MTNLDDTRHCPMCEDAAKKIRELESDRARIAENLIQALKRERELERRVKVLTEGAQSALDYLSDVNDLDDRCQWKQFVIAKDKLRESVRLTPQQTAAQIERWHIEWMMKLPVIGTVEESGEMLNGNCYVYIRTIRRVDMFTKLFAIPPLPKESNSPETDLDEALRRQ